MVLVFVCLLFLLADISSCAKSKLCDNFPEICSKINQKLTDEVNETFENDRRDADSDSSHPMRILFDGLRTKFSTKDYCAALKSNSEQKSPEAGEELQLSSWKNIYVGHAAVVQSMTDKLEKKRDGFRHAVNQPIVVMLFGPSGTGKSFFGETLASVLASELIEVSLNSYTESTSAARLTGANPGYVGYDGASALAKLKKHKNAVVLLDEAERAHSNVHKFFYNVFDSGHFTMANGDEIDCSQAIFILTSNIGAEHFTSDVVCTSALSSCPFHAEVISNFTKIFDGLAFLNRIEVYYAFSHFLPSEAQEIGERLLHQLRDTMCSKRGYLIGWEEHLVHKILEHSTFARGDGVRALERIFAGESEVGVWHSIWKQRKLLKRGSMIVLYWNSTLSSVSFHYNNSVSADEVGENIADANSDLQTKLQRETFSLFSSSDSSSSVSSDSSSFSSFSSSDSFPDFSSSSLSSDSSFFSTFSSSESFSDFSSSSLSSDSSSFSSSFSSNSLDSPVSTASSDVVVNENSMPVFFGFVHFEQLAIATSTWFLLTLLCYTVCTMFLPVVLAKAVAVIFGFCFAIVCYHLAPALEFVYHSLIFIGNSLLWLWSFIPDKYKPTISTWLLMLLLLFFLRRPKKHVKPRTVNVQTQICDDDFLTEEENLLKSTE